MYASERASPSSLRATGELVLVRITKDPAPAPYQPLCSARSASVRCQTCAPGVPCRRRRVQPRQCTARRGYEVMDYVDGLDSTIIQIQSVSSIQGRNMCTEGSAGGWQNKVPPNRYDIDCHSATATTVWRMANNQRESPSADTASQRPIRA